MNFFRLDYRLEVGGFSAKAYLCDRCWNRVHAFEDHDKDDVGWFQFTVTQGKHESTFWVQYHAKGGYDRDGQCDLCGAELGGSAEKVWFHLPVIADPKGPNG